MQKAFGPSFTSIRMFLCINFIIWQHWTGGRKKAERQGTWQSDKTTTIGIGTFTYTISVAFYMWTSSVGDYRKKAERQAHGSQIKLL
jgi:hypothetical protein